jgi:hypothetical protein
MSGPSGADVAGALEALSGPETDRLTRAVVSAGAARIRSRAFADFRGHGIGAAIWGLQRSSGSLFVGPGAKNTGAKASNVIRARVKKGDHAYTLTFSLTGLPAMTEEGGQTRRHAILPRLRDALRFPDGGFVGKQGVNHPGGPVPKNQFLLPGIEAEAPRITGDWEKALDGFIERATSKTKGSA